MAPPLVLAVCAVATLALAQKPKKPAAGDKPKDAQALVEDLFAIDPFAPAKQLDADLIVRELSATKLASKSDVDAWSERLAKVAAKRPKLEAKSGAHHLWEKPKERGLYIVGGETRAPKGLVVSMHGGGAGSGDAWSAHGFADAAAKKFDWLAIHPEVLEKTEHGWTDSGTEEFVLQLVDAALRTWKIDRDRVYLCGHSMGGYGTWTLGAHHADRVAGLAASAGAPTPIVDGSGNVTDIAPGVIPNLRNVPIVFYQSDDDPNVPPATNRMAALRLAEAQKRWGGFPYEYWEVPKRAHDVAPGGFKALFEKIEARERDTRPTKVVWQPALRWKRQMYWLFWTSPVVGALVEAEVDRATNTIRVVASVAAKGLEVLVDEKLVDLSKPVVVMLNGTEVFRGTPEAELGTLARTWTTGDPALAFARRIPLVP